MTIKQDHPNIPAQDAAAKKGRVRGILTEAFSWVTYIIICMP